MFYVFVVKFETFVFAILSSTVPDVQTGHKGNYCDVWDISGSDPEATFFEEFFATFAISDPVCNRECPAKKRAETTWQTKTVFNKH